MGGWVVVDVDSCCKTAFVMSERQERNLPGRVLGGLRDGVKSGDRQVHKPHSKYNTT